MKYQITHLKAPWPAGAGVGDVIDMDDLPAWALGKATPAPEGAKVTVSFKKADPATAGSNPNAERAAAEAKTAALAAEASQLGIKVDGLADEQIEAEIAKAKKAAETAKGSKK